MGFSFNPLLWFVCKLCKDTFPSPDELKIHKLRAHLGDCLKIKCIVFEEKLLDYEWAPAEGHYENNNNINKNQENLDRCQYPIIVNNKTFSQKKDSIVNVSNKVVAFGSSSRKKSCFINPSVSLTRLTQSELNIALNVNTNREYNEDKNLHEQQLLVQPDEIKIEDESDPEPEPEPEPEDFKLFRENARQSTSILKELLLKPKSDSIKDDPKSSKKLLTETTSNSNSNPNTINDISDKVENADSISLDIPEFLENREYIVASVEKNMDGSGQVKFASTFIPTSAHEFTFLKQQKLYPTILSVDEPNFNVDNYLKQSELQHQEPSVPTPAPAPVPGTIVPCPQRQLSNFEVSKTNPPTDAHDGDVDVDGQKNQLGSKGVIKPMYIMRLKKVTTKSKVSAQQIRPKQRDKPAAAANEFTYYICPICNKIFTLPSELNRHKQVHDNFHCRFDHCTMTFPTEERQIEHARKCVWK